MASFTPHPHVYLCYRHRCLTSFTSTAHHFSSLLVSFHHFVKKKILPLPSQPLQAPFSFPAHFLWKEVCWHFLQVWMPPFLLPRTLPWPLGYSAVTLQWKSHCWAHVANPTVTYLSSFHWTSQWYLSRLASSPFLKHFPSWLLWLTWALFYHSLYYITHYVTTISFLSVFPMLLWAWEQTTSYWLICFTFKCVNIINN